MKDLLIVVPYRNREEHLKTFLEKTPAYFNRQNISYDILICELDKQGDWNAGLCCNSFIDFINSERQYKYIFIHHVDVFPIEGEWEFPKPKQIFYKLGDYGSCLISTEDFLSVNGYCNSFWGWGGEDNDLYLRTQDHGIALVDRSNSEVKFDTGYQNHQRDFNGANYANGIKNLSVLKESKTNNITNFKEHGYTKDLKKIKDNIYHHIVVPKKTSPCFHKNDKVLLTFSKGNIDFEKIAFFIKSACIFSAYEFDVVVVIGDDVPNERFKHQIEIHGAKTFLPQTKSENLFIDRFACYKEFLLKHPQYTQVIHTDFTDVFFQANPFNHVVPDKLNFVKEHIKIKNENWNNTILNTIYPVEIASPVSENEVICSGVIYGPTPSFLSLCNRLVEERNKLSTLPVRGVDQPILNKLVYFDHAFDSDMQFRYCYEDFCINLHAVKYYPALFVDNSVTITDKEVTNCKRNKFSIVHQFNRYPDLFMKVQQHYVRSYNLF